MNTVASVGSPKLVRHCHCFTELNYHLHFFLAIGTDDVSTKSFRILKSACDCDRELDEGTSSFDGSNGADGDRAALRAYMLCWLLNIHHWLHRGIQMSFLQ
ncbi:hypothetical protein ACFX11_038104 [Malus domestica]